MVSSLGPSHDFESCALMESNKDREGQLCRAEWASPRIQPPNTHARSQLHPSRTPVLTVSCCPECFSIAKRASKVHYRRRKTWVTLARLTPR
jgi:hypothetical protein